MKPRGRRNKIGGQFSAKLIEMIESPAWRALSLSARRLIDRVEIELGHHAGKENGALPVTYSDFLAYGVGDRTSIAAARREAVALGFLRFKPGRGGNREFRRPDLFGLTYAVGDATHNWRKVETLEDAWAIAAVARKAKDPRAVEVGLERARRRAKIQESGLEKPQSSVGKTRTETGKPPVRENRTTASVGKTRPLSISGDGARSAPAKSAEASAPSTVSVRAVPSEEMLDIIMRSAGCTRAEAVKRFGDVPNSGGTDVPAPRFEQPPAIPEDIDASAYCGA
jgi:hypothetical protein